MEEEIERNLSDHQNKFHLAGVIPIACQPLDFALPWHESLMPIGINYLAFERSVYECAMAGCETIWIVAHRETTPLLRHRLGDWVLDPVNHPAMRARYENRANEQLKHIPLYYLPISAKDRDVRDGLVWSILYGAKRAYEISHHFSRWVTPNRYYVSFPYSVYPVSGLRENRRNISISQNLFVQTPDGKTIRDGALAGFTMSQSEFSLYLKSFRQQEQLRWKNAEWKDGNIVGERLAPDQQYTGRFIKPEQVFATAQLDGAIICNLPWYNDISSWALYRKYMGSKNARGVKRPSFGLSYHEFNPIGVDSEVEAHLDVLDEE